MDWTDVAARYFYGFCRPLLGGASKEKGKRIRERRSSRSPPSTTAATMAGNGLGRRTPPRDGDEDAIPSLSVMLLLNNNSSSSTQ
jgi:hypothetical protein